MKRLLVDKNISIDSVLFLNSLGFEIIFSETINTINNSTNSHPDMQFVKIGDKTAIVASQLLDYYKSKLPDYNLFSIDNITSPYPSDTILNFVVLGDTVICTKHQYDSVIQLKDFKCIFVKQGYTKCSVCVLNNNAIITGDMGILKSLENSHIRAYFLCSDEISLDGYNNGFWGGSSGLLGDDRLFFNGNIESLSCYKQLESILTQEKIEPVYHKKTNVFDNGSIILLD